MFFSTRGGGVVYSDDATTATEGVGVWKIIDNESEIKDSKYSVYVKEGTQISGAITASKGVDVSALDTQVDIEYTNNSGAAQTAIINGNGGTLTVDAPNDTVYSYGTKSTVTIKEVAGQSFHEFGKVEDQMTIAKGRIYLEATADVSDIHCKITVTTDGGTAGPVQIVIEAAASATMGNIIAPVFSIGMTIQIGSGLSDKVTPAIDSELNQSLTTIGENYFDGGLGTVGSPFLVATEDHLLNVNELVRTEGTSNYYFKQTADIGIETTKWWNNKDNTYQPLQFQGVYDGDNKTVYIAENDQNINRMCLFRDCGSVTVKNLNVQSVNSCLLSVMDVAMEATSLTLYNINASNRESGVVQVSVSNTGIFISEQVYTKNPLTISIDRCYANMNLTNSGACTGVFFGGTIYWNHACKDYTVSLTNSGFSGAIYGNGQAGVIFGNYAGYGQSWGVSANYVLNRLTVENVSISGALYATNSGIVSTAYSVGKELHQALMQKVTGGVYSTLNVLENASLSAYYDATTRKFTFGGTGYKSEYTYKLAVVADSIATDKNSAYNGRSVLVDVAYNNSPNAETKVSKGMVYTYSQAVLAKVFAAGTQISYDYLFESKFYVAIYVGTDNKVYFIINDPDQTGYPTVTNNTLSLWIYAYDSNGILVGKKSL